MNTNFLKKAAKLVAAGAVAGLGMLAGDRIADDKSAFGLFNKKDDNDNENESENKCIMPDLKDEAEHIDSTDVKVEDEVKDKEDE